MNYQLIVLDLDGTLFSTNHTILEETKAALIKAQQMGIKIALASGRATHGMLEAAKTLQLDQFDGYLLAYNGGQIISAKNFELIYENALTSSTCCELYDLAQEFDVSVTVYQDDLILTSFADDYIVADAQITNMRIKCLGDFKKELNFNPVKCMYVGHPEQIQKSKLKLLLEKGEELSITPSMPYYLEFMAKDIDKATSLQTLLNYLSLTPDQIIAIGDSYNDLTMIEFAGLGVAMGNAFDDVKKCADYVTLSNDESGIADVIERFIFNAN